MGPQIVIGKTVRRSLSVFGSHFFLFVGISLVVLVPSLAVQFSGVNERVAAGEIDQLPEMLLGILLGVLLPPIATALIVGGVVRHERGQPVTFADCVRIGGSRWTAVVGLALVVAIVCGFGFLLCIVPGVILQLGLIVAAPVLIVESESIGGALSRSWGLTEGNRLLIFGIFLQVFGVVLIVELAMMALLAGGIVATATATVVQWLVNVVSVAFGAVLTTVIYFELRRVKEELGLDEIASTAALFD